MLLKRRPVTIKRVLPLLLLSVVVLSVRANAAEEFMNRRVSGKVVATDIEATPNTIVVKAKTWKKQSLVVGADVTGKTVIKKGENIITLRDIKPGENVDMAYTRNSVVVATSIKVK